MTSSFKPETPKLETVVAYLPYPQEHAVTWLRVVRPLQQAGLNVLDGSADGINPELVAQADAVVIQREFPAYSSAAYTRILQNARALRKPVIYEIDDLLLELPPEHPDHHIHYYTYALLPILRALIEADLVSTTTPVLKSYFQQLNPHTCVLPNYLDDNLWQPKHVIASEAKQSLTASEGEHSDSRSKITIGYMGSVTHVPDLAEITPVLLRLVDRYPEHLFFKFWGAPPPPELAARASIEWVAKELPNYPRFSEDFSQQHCDIFIAPLADSYFNQCKSAIKFLEYSIQGIPGVYSRIAPYEAIVQPSENGMLAASLQEWETALVALIESQELRLTLGQKAQESVLRDWRLSDHAHEWLEAYQAAQANANTPRNSQPALRAAPGAGDSDLSSLILRLGVQVQAYLDELRAQNAGQGQEIEALTNQIHAKDFQLAELEARSLRSERRLTEIENSESWRLILKIGKIKKKFHG